MPSGIAAATRAMLRKRRYELLLGQIDSDAPFDTRYAAAVELDSYGWQYDQLLIGSIGNIRRIKLRHGAYDATGEFTLEGGGHGWARVHFENDNVSCIELWDMPRDCRPLNRIGPPTIPPEQPPEDTSSATPLPGLDVGHPQRPFAGLPTGG